VQRCRVGGVAASRRQIVRAFTTIASPSIVHVFTGRLAIASTMRLKRSAKQYPLREYSRTRDGIRRATMRKPSCLISCTQPGPDGGASAARGRHGSIGPGCRRGGFLFIDVGDRVLVAEFMARHCLKDHFRRRRTGRGMRQAPTLIGDARRRDHVRVS
jgi:hypothetical protein